MTTPPLDGTTPDTTSGVVPSPDRAGAVARGVIWDLGNVIVDWDPFHAIAAGVGEAAIQQAESEQSVPAADAEAIEALVAQLR